MGWCSATDIFDLAVGMLLDNNLSAKDRLHRLIVILEGEDWDCQQSSAYWDNPVVREVFMELHPRWFRDN